MKNVVMKIYFLLAILLMLVLVSCGGLKMKYFTRINPDGTVFKRVTAIGDSSDVYSNPFTFNVNDAWSVTYDAEIDTLKGDTLYIVIAEKTFDSVSDALLAFHRPNDTNLLRENIYMDLQRKFRWFFTFNTYQETFEQRFPIKRLSIDDFLSSEELAYFIAKDSSIVEGMSNRNINLFEKKIENNFGRYLNQSTVYEFVDLLEKYSIKKGVVFSHDDKVRTEDFLFGLVSDKFEFFNSDFIFDDLFKLSSKIDSFLITEWVSEAYNEHYFDKITEVIDSYGFFLFNEDEIKVAVDLPGMIYSTNGSLAGDNVVTWSFPGSIYQYKDYNIFVRYRTTNWWAFAVTGLFVFVIILWILRVKK